LGATHYVIAQHANFSLLGPASMSQPGASFTPARPGETIILYANGFGLPSTTIVEGSATQTGQLPALPTVQIGNLPANVTFAGVISPGLYQLNVTVPASAPSGDNAVTCSYAGVTTPAGALIPVQ
jgi:uncharacterized protein (TIGR03437 family)